MLEVRNPIVFIYTLADPRTGFVRYVGKAFDLRIRYNSHLAEKRNTRKNNWIKQLKLQGLKPVLEVLEVLYDATDDEWQETERYWISSLRFLGLDLTNLDNGGHGGRRASLETRLKLSISHRGKQRSAHSLAKLSQTLSQEWKTNRDARRAALKNSPKVQAQCAKMTQLRVGSRHTPETIAKMAQARRDYYERKRTNEPLLIQ